VRLKPWVLILILAACGAVFFLQLSQGEAVTYAYSAVPFEITRGVDLVGPQVIWGGEKPVTLILQASPRPVYLTLITSMFLHGGWLHLLGNMLYLWIFGDQIEDRLGHFRFLLFYLLCGLLAALAQVAVMPDARIPTLGASGAIAGVLGAYWIRFPRNRVNVLVLRYIVPMPAWIVLGSWILVQVASQVGLPAGASSGVAYMAHIGGFVAGLFLLPAFEPKRRLR
jgi:membrane associated rhomboid family serine protease